MGNRKPHSGLKHDKTVMTNDPNRKLKPQCAVCGKASCCAASPYLLAGK